MEAAIAIASIVAVVVTCIGAISAVSMHVRCVDAARETARLVARGDDPPADGLAPSNARIMLSHKDGIVVVRVEADTALPGLTVRAEAAAAMESENHR